MSTYHNPAVDNNFATDAEWRSWCDAVDQAMRASGFLVLAADTGQIDLTTAVRPSAGAFAGFKMYKANDALQATKPVFVKLEFGVASATNRGKLQLSVSTATNGAGTPTGQIQAGNSLINPSGDGSGFCRVFGGGGEFDAWMIIYDGSTSSQACHFAIGRLIDRDDGSEVGPITWFSWTQSSTSTPFNNFYYSDGTSGWGSVSSGIASFCPDLGIAIHTGGDVNKTLLYEWLVYRAAKTLCFPCVAGRAQELPFTDPDASAFSLNVWGGSHTFVPMPWATGVNLRPGLLWE
jgi:hypothetical protein